MLSVKKVEQKLIFQKLESYQPNIQKQQNIKTPTKDTSGNFKSSL